MHHSETTSAGNLAKKPLTGPLWLCQEGQCLSPPYFPAADKQHRCSFMSPQPAGLGLLSRLPQSVVTSNAMGGWDLISPGPHADL